MGKIVGLVFAAEAAKLTCPHCGEAYKTEEALAKHRKDKHLEDPGNSGESPKE